MQTAFIAEKLWNGSAFLHDAMVTVDSGRIISVQTRFETEAPVGVRIVDLGALTLAPAFLDVHIHGSAGHDVMEGTPEALQAIGRFLASRGTGAYLATTVTAPLDSILRSLSNLAKLIQHPQSEGAAWPIGIHLEGPFLSHSKRGVHPPDLLMPADVKVFDRMWEASEGTIRLITLAPEILGAVELASHATAKGVRVSVGHSDATAAQTRAAIAAGATSATHTFNAMRALDHREPGILGTVLTTDNLFAELICDGIHTAHEIVRLWWKAKGADRGLLVTDAMSAAGMPDGTYQLGGFGVEVSDGRAMANGVLAGSVLTLDRALTNFLAFTGAPLHQALRLLTTNPAAMIGCEGGVGTLKAGGVANMVAVDSQGTLVASIHNGELIER